MIWVKLAILAIVIVSGWIGTMRLRRRMKKALGRDVSETELTSLNAWMEIEERQEKSRGYTPSTSDNAHIK